MLLKKSSSSWLLLGGGSASSLESPFQFQMSASFFGTQTHSKVYRHKVSNGVRRKTYTSPFWPVRFFSKLLLWKKTDWLHFLLSLLSLLHTTQIPEIDLMLRQELREVRYINTAGGVFPLFELLSGLGKIDKKWERLMENQNKSTLPSFSRSPKPFFTRVSCSPRLFEDEMNES